MTIYHGIRAAQLKPYPQGEIAFAFEEKTMSQEAILSTHNRPGKIEVLLSRSEAFPAELTLTTTLVPIALHNQTCKAHVFLGSKALGKSFYYGDDILQDPDDLPLAQNSRYQAVELHFANRGVCGEKAFQGTTFQNLIFNFESEGRILRKEFCTQTQATIVHRYGDSMTDDPPSFPLFAYGGYYGSGVSLDKIVMVFGSFSFFEEKTALTLYSLLSLQQENILPPYGGLKNNVHWTFKDDLTQDHCLSLAQSIDQGAAKVTVYHKTSRTSLRYISSGYRQPHPEKNEVDLIFVPDFKRRTQ